MTRRTVSILGSTGSVGTTALRLIEAEPDRFALGAITGGSNVELLAEQARRCRPALAVIADERRHDELRRALAGSGIETAAGAAAIVEAAERPSDVVLAAIVGAAGLAPTMAAVRRGAVIGLANKECLVCAGALLMAEVERCGARLLPVDSEHSAIFQVFEFDAPGTVEEIVLTASGGPFRTWSLAEMAGVTPEQALAHPNWSMGAKISVDSATMMNKGLEIIEAAHLFPVPSSAIRVVVHPQSVVHSMVAYRDGSVLAQLGSPDMTVPIAYALGWPERLATPAERLDFARLSALTFEAPDPSRFPALRLAREAHAAGGAAPVALNAANEVAVGGFLAKRLKFLDIARSVEDVLARLVADAPASLEDVLACDAEARRLAETEVARRSAGA